MKKAKEHIVAFLSLEDFAQDASVNATELVRVQAIRRSTGGKPEHRMIQWIVLVTALTVEGVAMTSICTGQRWEIFEEDDKLREENAETATVLIREDLDVAGYNTAWGVYEPQAVMDNIVGAGCALWRFEEGRLVPIEESDG